MKDFVLSLVRTYVPIVVGAALAWLATKGIEVDSAAASGLVLGLSGLIMAGYYALARLIEQKAPVVGGLMLGAPNKAPKYATKQHCYDRGCGC